MKTKNIIVASLSLLLTLPTLGMNLVDPANAAHKQLLMLDLDLCNAVDCAPEYKLKMQPHAFTFSEPAITYKPSLDPLEQQIDVHKMAGILALKSALKSSAINKERILTWGPNDINVLLLEPASKNADEQIPTIDEPWKMIKKTPVEEMSLEKKNSSLHDAVRKLQPKKVQLYLEHGANSCNPSTRNGSGSTPLEMAVFKRNATTDETVRKFLITTIETLIKHGADVNKKFRSDSLSQAARYNNEEANQLATEQPTSHIYLTPLARAACFDDLELAQLLIQHNADIDEPIEYNNITVTAYNFAKKNVQIFLKHELDNNTPDSFNIG